MRKTIAALFAGAMTAFLCSGAALAATCTASGCVGLTVKSVYIGSEPLFEFFEVSDMMTLNCTPLNGDQLILKDTHPQSDRIFDYLTTNFPPSVAPSNSNELIINVVSGSSPCEIANIRVRGR